jgi:hypothetical protein
MKDSKKIAAAMAAVMNYIKTQEEAAAAGPQLSQAAPAGPAARINFYGMSGRQSNMQMRNLMQMRGFHGSKLR